MEKVKLIDARKTKDYSQNKIAELLRMDVSNYNRSEKGQSKISHSEWEKLSEILEIPVEDIYESEDSYFFLFKDNSTGNYLGTNHIYSIPEYLLESQRKYICKLEEEILHLKNLLESKK